MVGLNAADVLARFSMLAGEEEAERFLPLCADAAAELETGERPDCGEEGHGALCAAAAALAFRRFALARAGRGTSSFSAGDVRVAESAADPGAAGELWRQALAAAAPYLEDTGCFLFGRIGP